MAIYNTYFSVLGLQDSLGVLPNLGVLPGLGRLDDLGEYAFSPTSLFLNGEQGVWYDPSDLTPEKVSWRRNLLTYSQDFENAAWTKSNASILSNLALYSQDFDNAAWTKQRSSITANTAVAPDGTSTADKLVEDTTASNTHRMLSTSTITVSSGITVTNSVFVKAAERTWAVLSDGGSSGVSTIYFNLANGTFGTVGVGVTQYSATNLGNGWYRIQYSCVLAGALSQPFIGIATADNTATYTGDGTSGILVWGAQLVPGSTAQTYTRSLATAAPIQFADPLGGTLADKLVENTVAAEHRIFGPGVSLTAGVVYAISTYVKAAERSIVGIAFTGPGVGGGILGCYVNLSTQVVTNFGTGPASTTVTSAGDGWFRVTITATATANGLMYAQLYTIASVGSTSYTGDGVSGIYVYGAQVEQASTASAYQRITDFSSDFLAAFPTHALYQESTGVTPVTALGQSVGLVLDKRLGALTAVQPISITNSTFTSGSTGWSSTNATLNTTVSGQIDVTSTSGAAFGVLEQAIVAPAGALIRVEVDCEIVSGTGFIGLWTGTTGLSTTFSDTGRRTRIFYAPVAVTNGSAVRFGGTATIGNTLRAYSVRAYIVPGNHAIQATSAARPTLQARSNLLVRTEDFADAAWSVKINPVYGVTDPNGGTAAVRVTSSAINQIVLRQSNYNSINLATYRHRVAIRRVSGTGVIELAGSNNQRVDITSQVSSAWSYVFIDQQNLQATGANGYFYFQLAASGDSIEVAFPDARLISDTGAGIPPYQRVTTATDYADVSLPRNLTFDGVDDSLATAGNVDFATWTVGTRRNLLTVPTMFDDAAWAVTGLTRTANTIVAPDGTQTGDTITGNSATNAVIFPNAGVSASATNYTFSVYLNLGTASFAVVSLWSGSGTNGVNVWVNGSTGALTGSTNTTAGYTLVSSSSTAVGGGWYRIAVTGTLPAATVYVSVRLVDSDNAFVYTNTSGKTLNLWGAQLEVGSTATAFQDVGTDKVTLFSGVFKPSDDATRVIAELSVDKNSNNGVFFLNTEAAPRWYFESKGTLASSTNSGATTTFVAPITSVVTGLGDIGGDASIIRVNGTQLGSNTANQGTGNYGSYPLYIGRRASLSLPFNGRLFQLVIRGAATDSVTVGNAERWVGQLTGVAL